MCIRASDGSGSDGAVREGYGHDSDDPSLADYRYGSDKSTRADCGHDSDDPSLADYGYDSDTSSLDDCEYHSVALDGYGQISNDPRLYECESDC